MIAICRTEGCPENGVEKHGDIVLSEGEEVLCGECLWPCDVSGVTVIAASTNLPEPPAYRRIQKR